MDKARVFCAPEINDDRPGKVARNVFEAPKSRYRDFSTTFAQHTDAPQDRRVVQIVNDIQNFHLKSPERSNYKYRMPQGP
jgi:Ni/Co efflux regulator RcnB